jgi:hypothetical protein
MSCIKDKVLGLQAFLDGKIENAPAYVASDIIHTYEILINRPGTCKIAVGFESEQARSNFPGGDITGRANQYLYAIISRGRGLNSLRAANLVYGSGGGSPLFDLAEQMRNAMRAIRFNAQTDEVPDYVSLTPWGQEIGQVLDAFKCTIWVGSQLPLPNLGQNNEPVL